MLESISGVLHLPFAGPADTLGGMNPQTRRDFLRASLGAAGAGFASSALSRSLRAEEAKEADDRPMPMRDLGRTGMKVSILAQGGYHLGTLPEKDAVALVHRACDLGINFFDNAWNYHSGRSEELLGKALRGARREKVFVMTKGERRSKAGAAGQIDESLRRMGMEYIDLWQFHGLQTLEEVEQVRGADGAMEAAQAALKAGKIRHIGLTGHHDPATHLRALDVEGVETLQMPINPLDAHHRSFQNEVLPKARRKGVGTIAMKTLVFGRAVDRKVYTAAESLRYVWGLEVDVLVSGMTSIELLEHNARLAKAFAPMAGEERSALLARVKPSAGTGIEFYKT